MREWDLPLGKISVGSNHNCAIKADGSAWCWGSNYSGGLGNGAYGNSNSKDHPVQVRASSGGGGNNFLTGVVQMELGGGSCALKADGSVWCWGASNYGQLGDGGSGCRDDPSNSQVTDPSQVVKGSSVSSSDFLENVVQVSMGNSYTCAVKADGSLWCWGRSAYGALGNDAGVFVSTGQAYTYPCERSPVRVVARDGGAASSDFLGGVVQVSTGADHTCAVKADGSLWCWGDNAYGQLGNDASGSSSRKDHPVRVVASDGGAASSDFLEGVVQVSTGTDHTCAVKADGSAWCWGNPQYGRLGNNNTIHHKDHPVRVLASDGGAASSDFLEGVVQVSARSRHTCAVKADGSAWCWGDAQYGQLGNDASWSSNSKARPVRVVAGEGSTGFLEGVVQVGAGTNHTCAHKIDGSVWCWGYGGSGQLGNDRSGNRDHPVMVVDAEGSSGVLAIGTYQRSYTCVGSEVSANCSLNTVQLALAAGSSSPSNRPSVNPSIEVSGIATGESVFLYPQ